MNGCSFQQVLLNAVLLHVTISAIFDVFNTLTLKQIFWKTNYRLLVESTKIENASLPYKNAT